ncbi:MAG TPA: hypothetical protein VFN23_05050 [Ktedonobacteraceae bacterium]|nr:hypothetical protein [Ktedonobacteraceae bacterium]
MEPAKGLLFVPIPSDHPTWRQDLVRKILEALGGLSLIQRTFDYRNLEHLRHDTEQTIQFIASQEYEHITCDNFGTFGLDFWLLKARPESSYQVLETAISKIQLSEIQRDPMRVEVFAQQWVSLCEKVGAEIAYFVESNFNSIDDVIVEALESLQRGDIEDCLRTEGSPWRCYLSPTIISRLGVTPDWSWIKRLDHLPSGGLVIHDGAGYNPNLGDLDAVYNATFLREQLEKHLDVTGGSVLLDRAKREEENLKSIMDAMSYIKHGDDARYDFDGVDKSRIILDDIRATLACALRRPGLVGVEQQVTDPTQQKSLTVLVMADGGREWLVPTLLFPFDRDSSDWSDPQTGLRVRVQVLLDLAQHRAEAPRVIAYFWRGVSPEVREALVAMGAQVEAADSLPLLG